MHAAAPALAVLVGAVLAAATPSAPAYNQQLLPSYGIASGLAAQEHFYSGYTVPLQTVSTAAIVIPVIGAWLPRSPGLSPPLTDLSFPASVFSPQATSAARAACSP